MYIFGSNGHMNVGLMDTPMDIEYKSGDSQAIIDNVIHNTFSIHDAEHSNKDSDIRAGLGPFFLNVR